jgi:hypothetical protein
VRIARVFPVKTMATPIDPLSFIDCEPGLFPPKVDEVHISVAFTWHKERAEQLAEAWKDVAPVKIGGPAYNQPGGQFEPGVYVKKGYTITSRGCPNHCWFCSVWRREPELIELPITPGFNVLDDNLLACSDNHIRSVFEMLLTQKRGKIEFTGGLEAKRLAPWHAELLHELKPKQLFFAYDTDDDYEPLLNAASLLWKYGISKRGHRVRAYVLIGYHGDTFDNAERRLKRVLGLGIIPMAMLWRNEKGDRDFRWRQFQRQWARAALISHNIV